MVTDDILLLGLDLGISTVKVALFTAAGDLVRMESDEYMIVPEGDKAETDPELYWSLIVRSTRRLLHNWGGRAEQIAAVSVSSHTETVVPIEESGRPVRPALLWMDKRSQPEADELNREFGLQRVLKISGQPEIAPIWPVTKFRWLSKHEPDSVKRTAKYLLPEDYLLYRLSGRFVAEPSMWSSSLVLDISQRKWSPEMMAFGGVRADQLPELLPSGTAVGCISPACAAETGLSTKTQVVTGGLDQTCAAIGAGNIAPGIITESTGSVLALLATVPKPIFDRETRVPCHIHAVPDAYCMLPWNQTGGLALKWFKDRFAGDLTATANATSRDVYALLAAEAETVPAGSEGLLMLPHLDGAFFPEFDPFARGVFFGFTLNHGRAHFTRAIMEAVAFMIRRDLEGLSRLGVVANELRVLGGGAKSACWSQIKADTCNIPVVVPAQGEAAALGSVILAAVGIGLYADIPSAVRVMVSAGSPVEPRGANRTTYDAAYRLYVELYDSVKHLYPQSAKLARLARCPTGFGEKQISSQDPASASNS